MPQGRIVLKSICQSKKIAQLKTDGARLLYTWLIPNLDIDGCFSGDEDVVNGQIFTRLKKTPKQIGEFLQDLHDNGLIQWYEFDEDKFLIVPDFADKQPSLNASKEAKSTIPAFTPDLLLPYSVSTPPKVKGSKAKGSKEEVKIKFKEFVILTKVEHEKLIKSFGDKKVSDMIQNLNDYIGSKGTKYKSHYHTILSWERKNGQKSTGQHKQTGSQQTSGSNSNGFNDSNGQNIR